MLNFLKEISKLPKSSTTLLDPARDTCRLGHLSCMCTSLKLPHRKNWNTCADLGLHE
jgi:hypothetical protein